MITSIRYRGFSFYYKDNDNKYKEIFDEILAYNFKTVKVLRNIDDTKVSLIDTKYGRYVFKVFAPKTKRNERFLKSFVKGDYYQNLIALKPIVSEVQVLLFLMIFIFWLSVKFSTMPVFLSCLSSMSRA